MDEEQINQLESLLAQGHKLFWSPDNSTAREVVSIGDPPQEEVPEPSRCGYFENGQFVALWNCEIEHFIVGYRFGEKAEETVLQDVKPLELFQKASECENEALAACKARRTYSEGQWAGKARVYREWGFWLKEREE